jgi:hypothetical protein
MALKGNLRDFTVTQLLNLINLAKKTGTLTVEGPEETAWVSFHGGRLIYAQLGTEDGTLTGILRRSRRISNRQAQIIKKHAPSKSDKELGLLLINADYLSQQDILDSIRKYILNIVYRLFAWGDGFFRFDNNVLPPGDRITIRISLENVIIEGSRKVREWEQLREEIPNLDMALNFVDRPGANIRDVNLNVDEWKVVSYINPKNSIRQIARANKMSEVEIRRIVYGLMQAGLVDLIRAEGMKMPAQASQIKPMDQQEQASLVNRLIDRIRSL